MRNENYTLAIWPWGTETKEQFEQAARDMAQIGYRYYESVKAAVDLFTANPHEFEDINARYGIQPASFYFHMSGDRAEDVDGLKAKLPFLQKHGVHHINLQGVWVGQRRATPEEEAYTLSVIQEVGRICRDYDILPCVHPHMNTSVMVEDQIDAVMERTDPDQVGFGPDTAHMLGAGCDPVAIIRRYAKRVAFTHLKDLMGDVRATGFEAGVEVYDNFCELGRGNVDFPAIFEILRGVGYDGFLTVELDRSRTSNFESAKENFAYLKAHYNK